jgi:hypothetical protein
MLGAFASIHTYSTNPENSPVPTHQQVSSGQQENKEACAPPHVSAPGVSARAKKDELCAVTQHKMPFIFKT